MFFDSQNWEGAFNGYADADPLEVLACTLTGERAALEVSAHPGARHVRKPELPV
jgi:hypothetical protein